MMQKFSNQILQNQLMYYNSVALNQQRHIQNNIYLNMIIQRNIGTHPLLEMKKGF